jgi:hypothetical protein
MKNVFSARHSFNMVQVFFCIRVCMYFFLLFCRTTWWIRWGTSIPLLFDSYSSLPFEFGVLYKLYSHGPMWYCDIQQKNCFTKIFTNSHHIKSKFEYIYFMEDKWSILILSLNGFVFLLFHSSKIFLNVQFMSWNIYMKLVIWFVGCSLKWRTGCRLLGVGTNLRSDS